MLVRFIEWRCHACGHHVSAMTEAALEDAMNAHAEFVNATKDRETDAHFDEVRVNALLP